MYRDHTKVIQIGDRKIGGGNPILIQSMTNTKTEDVEQTVAQILALEQAGCDIIRCAVPTMEAAKALKEIKKQIHIPLVADIHFDYRLLRDQFMSLCTHKDIRRFDADHQIVISQVFDDMNFIQRTLHQSLCSDSMIFLHKFFLKRTTVYTNTNGYSSLLCHINHCFDSLCTADISGIDPDLICTVFHGCKSTEGNQKTDPYTTCGRYPF